MKIDIEKEAAALRQATTGQLHERYAELFGETSQTRHKAYIIRKIAWRLQANAEGGLSERAQRRARKGQLLRSFWKMDSYLRRCFHSST